MLLAGQDGSYEVVDGQQRLTTLLLILRHFNDRAAKKYQQTLYALVYATRPDLLAFLENPSDVLAKKNIDYFHIAQAMKVIEAWFAKRESEVEAIKDTFLNKAKVIWFQLSAGENPVAAFTRLNVGKIPLTNGELIRALFLRSAPGEADEGRRLRIAYEWDLVEKALQDPALWSFLRNETGPSGGRIDFLFTLAARQQGMKAGTDDYATFNHFSQKLAYKDADPAEAWLEVKKIWFFRTICGRFTAVLSIWHELPTASVVRSSRATPARRRGQLRTVDCGRVRRAARRWRRVSGLRSLLLLAA